MNKIMRIILVLFLITILLPTYTRAETIWEDRGEHKSSEPCPDGEDDPDCYIIPLSSQPNTSVSNDLLYWEGNNIPVLEQGPSGSWDETGVIGPEVLYTGTQYMMWYSGYGLTRQIGLATSYNGLTWEKSPLNPVLTVGEPGSWDDKEAWAPAVIRHSSIWEMWYVGSSSASGSQIGYATSNDGLDWVKYPGNPVFSPGILDEWESSGLISPYVMFEDGIYHMWYSNDPQGHIGYAVSTDGIHWERYKGNPLISPWGGDEDCGPVMYVSPTVIHLDEYHMWYQEGQECRGGVNSYVVVHSTSPDRVNWSVREGAYGGLEGRNAHYPTVISHHDGLLKQMWYVAFGDIYYAEENLLEHRIYLPLTNR